MSLNPYLHEEHSCQISYRSDPKQQSWASFEEITQQEEQEEEDDE